MLQYPHLGSDNTALQGSNRLLFVAYNELPTGLIGELARAIDRKTSMIIFKRSDPSRRMARWYCLALTTDLFGQPALYRAWGSRRTTYQHVRCDPYPSAHEALAAAQQIISRRQQHGYQEIYNDQTIRPGGKSDANS